MTERVEKGWGHEEIWASNNEYCAKFLHFNTGAKSSMHFHLQKRETWYVLEGEFEIEILSLTDAHHTKYKFVRGGVLDLRPMTPHRVTCLQRGIIAEVSTKDLASDNYRVEPGDSQKAIDNASNT